MTWQADDGGWYRPPRPARRACLELLAVVGGLLVVFGVLALLGVSPALQGGLPAD